MNSQSLTNDPPSLEPLNRGPVNSFSGINKPKKVLTWILIKSINVILSKAEISNFGYGIFQNVRSKKTKF